MEVVMADGSAMPAPLTFSYSSNTGLGSLTIEILD